MLRTELFSLEKLKRHARSLTGKHLLEVQRGPDRILPRLTDNARVLLVAYDLVTAGGHIANLGGHGKPVQLNLDKLWSHNITFTTGLVDTVTTPMLLKTVISGKVHPEQLVTHHFALQDVMQAYETFGNAIPEGALKVIITND